MKTTDIVETDIIFDPHSNAPRAEDHEVKMARSELYRAGKSAMALHGMLKSVSEQQGLEGWVQAKITKAADYLESVYHYLDYEMKDRHAEVEMEAAPVAPAAQLPGQAVTPASPGTDALAKQKAAAAVALQRKQIQDQIKALQKQLQDAQKQMTTLGQVANAQQAQTMAETTSAGAIASSMGGNGMGMKKKEIGSLFGGTYKQAEEDLSEIKKGQKDANGYTKCWPGKHAEGTKKGKNGGRVRNCVPNENIEEAAMTTMRPQGEKPWSPSLDAPKKKYPAIGTVAWENLPKSTKVMLLKKRGRNPDEYFGTKTEAANPAQQAAIAINMKKAGKKPKHNEEEMEEGVDIRNRPVPQIQTAIARSRKIPNSKVIKLGPNRGYVVVDRSDPRPEVKPDLTVIGDVSKADQRYRQILKQMRRLEKEYDTLSPGKPELRTANVQNMLKNTNYRELSKEKQKMMAIIKQHEDQPRHMADQGVAEGGIPTYIVSVMDSATGEHWSIEVKVTSPEAARERAEAMGYKVLSVKEKQGVKEGWKGAAAGAALLGLGAMGAGGQAQAADMNKAGVSNMKAPTQATQVAKQEQLKRYPTDPRPDLKLGSLEDMFFNGNTNHDREIRYLNYQTDSSAKNMTPQEWSAQQGPKNSPMKALTPDQQAARAKLPLRTANWHPDDDRMPATIREKAKDETGPKFTGYWKGTDKGKPGKKMVGDA